MMKMLHNEARELLVRDYEATHDAKKITWTVLKQTLGSLYSLLWKWCYQASFGIDQGKL